MRKASCLFRIGLLLAASAGSALAGKIELPEWSGGPGPENYVLGGTLWPDSKVEPEVPKPVNEPAEVAAAENAKPAKEAPKEASSAPPAASEKASGILPRIEKVVQVLRGTPQNLRLPIALIQPLPIEQIEEVDNLPPVVGELKEEYFALRPVEPFVDPQQLVTEQKAIDVLRFLEFHAEEAEYDIYLLIFGRNQEVPEDISLTELHNRWFADEKAVTVAYFLEEPERTEIAFNTEVKERLPEAVFDRIYQNCIREAQVAETPFDQVERLAIELSIRLYWMSKLLERQSAGERIATTQEELSQPAWENFAQPDIARADKLAQLLGVLPWGWILGGVAFVMLVVSIAAYLWRRDALSARPVLFPEREMPTRLGGDYSGGAYIGISFEVGEGS